jgi:hypothetical protein
LGRKYPTSERQVNGLDLRKLNIYPPAEVALNILRDDSCSLSVVEFEFHRRNLAPGRYARRAEAVMESVALSAPGGLHLPLKFSHERRRLLTIPPLAQTQVLPTGDYGDVMVVPPAFDLRELCIISLSISIRQVDHAIAEQRRSPCDDLSNVISQQ